MSASYEPADFDSGAEVLRDFTLVVDRFVSAVDAEYKLLRIVQAAEAREPGWHVNCEGPLRASLRGRVVLASRGEA